MLMIPSGGRRQLSEPSETGKSSRAMTIAPGYHEFLVVAHLFKTCEYTSLKKSGRRRLQTVYKTTVRISLSPFAPRKLVGVTAVSRDLTSQCSRPHSYTNSLITDRRRRGDEFLFLRHNMLGCHTTTTSHRSDIFLLAPLLRKLRIVLVRTDILPHRLGTIRCFQGPVRVDCRETLAYTPNRHWLATSFSPAGLF
jgi:hypothetical protein